MILLCHLPAFSVPPIDLINKTTSVNQSMTAHRACILLVVFMILVILAVFLLQLEVMDLKLISLRMTG